MYHLHVSDPMVLLLLQVYADALLVFKNARTYNKLPTEDVHYMANRVQVGPQE